MSAHYSGGDPARGCALGLLVGAFLWVIVLVGVAVFVAKLG